MGLLAHHLLVTGDGYVGQRDREEEGGLDAVGPVLWERDGWWGWHAVRVCSNGGWDAKSGWAGASRMCMAFSGRLTGVWAPLVGNLRSLPSVNREAGASRRGNIAEAFFRIGHRPRKHPDAFFRTARTARTRGEKHREARVRIGPRGERHPEAVSGAGHQAGEHREALFYGLAAAN